MKIVGLQKMTLLDYPGKVACTVFLGGCNFRCPFCHNSELLDGTAESVMDQQELLSFLEKRKGLLDGVCVTGGEPTLQKDLPQLLFAIKALGYAVKLDTNGYRPEVLKELVGQGLVDYVAMDVKNSPRRYAETAGLPGLDITRIEESLAFLLSGAVDYELRTTVAVPLHDDQAMNEIRQWLEKISSNHKARRFFIQPFVDRDTVMFAGLKTPEKPELVGFQGVLAHCAEQVSIRGNT
ncbi:MAG: anaerobic ribonucleoside-triphosphate reductase activating protein [Oscillospiraceae bacterium]|nr:anaerobic ribonucleoside-triphosphate reductase activating protein [Oscillospiraceae bacterium]